MSSFPERRQLSLGCFDAPGEVGQPFRDGLAVYRFEFIPEAPGHNSDVISKQLVRLADDRDPQGKALVDLSNDLAELLFFNGYSRDYHP